MELTFNQKKEIGYIAIRGSVASCDFNTKINCAIKRNKIYEDEDCLKRLNDFITQFKKDLIDYLKIFDYRVLELCYEMFTPYDLVHDMKMIDTLVNDELINFISLLVAFVEKIFKIRNSIVAVGCDRESCDKSLNKMISLLGVNQKYVR